MEYFCYISRRKVDKLLANLESNRYESWKESEHKESQLNTKASGGLGVSGVLSLFKGEASYGRKGTIQFEKEVKRTYLNKLQTVLEALAMTPGVFSLPNNFAQIRSLYYHYVGDFSPTEPVSTPQPETIVTIQSMLTPNTALLLDCSLRFFSESTTPDGNFMLHSGNDRFFKSDISLCFETIFVMLQHREKELIGTPLFLKLHSQDASNIFV